MDEDRIDVDADGESAIGTLRLGNINGCSVNVDVPRGLSAHFLTLFSSTVSLIGCIE